MMEGGIVETNDVLAKLKQIPLFTEIKENSDFMDELLRISRIKNYSRGDCIIREGEVGDEMYIVLTGGVEIRKKTRAGDDYTVVRLRAEGNVFFGELALIDDDTRSATVIATEDSSFIVINKKSFLQLGNQYPQIGLPITRAISRRVASSLRKTTEDMLTLFDALVNEVKG
jgi:CRP/FNR family cyclic AMP-dependent transcriptional regulator